MGAVLGYAAGGFANARRVTERATPQEIATRQRLGRQFNQDYEAALNSSDRSVLGVKSFDEHTSPEGKRFKGTFDRFMGQEQALRDKYEDPSYRPMGALIGAGAGLLGGAMYLRGRK
jgi:hypothetical protein